MNLILEELAGSLPDAREVVRVVIRLFAALVAGGIIGYQRERAGKAAGLRTHMLVALGTTLFVIGSAEVGMAQDAMSRVVQGLATGIGFLGAGAIIKLSEREQVKGLTTAASIWATAAIAAAAGLGRAWTAIIATLFAFVILGVLLRVEARMINR